MCDEPPVHRCAVITGLGNASPPQHPPSQGGVRGSYQWRLSARNAVDICAEIYPWILSKRKQIIVAWNHQIIRESYETKKGSPIPRDALEKQKLCRELIQALNYHKAVDIPGWMSEPKITVEPGWYLRSDCIWAKPNPMPESVTDRPTKAHEYLFLLTKSEKYYWDQEAVRENNADPDRTSYVPGARTHGINLDRNDNDMASRMIGRIFNGRNIRTVWTIATQPFPEAHFATFPEKLVEPCVLAGSREGDWVLDPFAGSGTVGVVCARLNRRFVGIELSEDYCKMAVKRIAPYAAQAHLPLGG